MSNKKAIWSIRQATFYNWRKKFGGLAPLSCTGCVSLKRRTRLKKLIVDLSLDKHMLQGVLNKNYEVSPPPRVGDRKVGILLGKISGDVLIPGVMSRSA